MASQSLIKYGLSWSAGTSPIQMELYCIAKGGQWKSNGQTVGFGLYHHFKAAMTLLWPKDDWHRWAELALKAICENEITVFLGCSSSGKTHMMAKFSLVDWWASPHNTLTLVSSTERRGAELRIWGNIKELFNRGKERFPDLPGYPVDSLGTITLQKLDGEDDDVARSLRTGIILVPCLSGGQYVGLGRFIGMKAERLRHVGDEVAAMKQTFLDAYDNWYGAPNFKGMMAANPIDPEGPEGVAAEPTGGWLSFEDNRKTQTWRSRFYNAFVVNFDGRDSPNYDFPQDQPPRFPYLITPKKIRAVAETYGEDSWHFSWQCAGKMRPGMLLNRVITREMCRRHHAHDRAVWKGDGQTMLYALDPAYGGGDRCLGRIVEFGPDPEGNQILKMYPPELVPINVGIEKSADDQIAEWIKARLEQLNIQANRCFYDSFGKGTIGFAFAKVFGNSCPVPVDSGARPTRRPVRFDLFVWDETTKLKRPKRCDEHYSKFVTEMWFSVSETIQSDQMRELPESTMAEGCKREYTIVHGNKIEIEPKDKFKEDHGFSPDDMDSAALGVEGARQLGFQIRRIGASSVDSKDDEWFDSEAKEHDSTMKSLLLEHR